MAKISKTYPWDVIEHLKSDDDMDAYLKAAVEDGDPFLITAALRDIGRAKLMRQHQGNLPH